MRDPGLHVPYMLATHRPFPQDVELISYYTTSDGIVDWRACVVPGAENIEVPRFPSRDGVAPTPWTPWRG